MLARKSKKCRSMCGGGLHWREHNGVQMTPRISVPMSPKPPPLNPAITELQAKARHRESFAVALLAVTRQRALQAEPLNPLAWTDWDNAQVEAEKTDAAIRSGKPLPALAGVPVSIKDLYSVRGTLMKAGTRAQLPDLGLDDAQAVRRLRQAGAIIFGKTQMHEIALGATGENAWTGDVLNPFDPLRQAGGSSSGAGVCVAKGIGLAGLGSDTGGSIRIPANFCGIVGFKPSFGAVPLNGALHLSWTCDHAGPLTRSVADARVVFEVLSQRRCEASALARTPTFAVPRQWLNARMSAEVAMHFEQALYRLRQAGAQIHEIETPALHNAWICYSPIVRAEAAHIHRASLAGGGEGFSASVLTALRAGQDLSAGEYLNALNLRSEVAAQLQAISRAYDAMILPTSAVLPPLRGQTEVMTLGGMTSVREAVLGQTLPFNLAGLPALTLPMGSHDGLPTGLQMVGELDADARLLALAQWVETLMPD